MYWEGLPLLSCFPHLSHGLLQNTTRWAVSLCWISFIYLLISFDISLFTVCAEGFWTTMAVTNFLQGNISWQRSGCHFSWIVWESASWYVQLGPRGSIWCCCMLSCYWHGSYIVIVDWKLWWPFRKQRLAFPVQGRCDSHCFWLIPKFVHKVLCGVRMPWETYIQLVPQTSNIHMDVCQYFKEF